MERNQATNHARSLLNEQGLKDWHVRLTMDITKPFLGLCSPKDKAIILNAHHIDTHPDLEVLNTIRHEVAHALTIGHAHDEIWAKKARELGCDNTLPCAHYGFSDAAIDAIRSGADLIVDFEEETHVIRKPKFQILKLQDKCPTCGKVAESVKVSYHKIDGQRKKLTTLKCNHIVISNADSQSPFEDITFDGDVNCKHVWKEDKKTECALCEAHRLYDYQVDGARALEQANGSFAIFDEMGLGKTIQALAYLKFHKADAWPFLWITKAGPIFQHGREIIRVIGPEATPIPIRNSKQLVPKNMNAIASYDIFRRMDLSDFDHFKTVVIDECQAIKNPDSTRTQCIRKIVRGSEILDDNKRVIGYNRKKVIPLSGTPWKNRGSEFFVVLNMLDPKQFSSYERFKNTEVDMYWNGSKYVEGGIREPEEFKKRIAHIAIRRERSEVMRELPLVNRTQQLCEVPDYTKQVYNEEAKKINGLMKDALLEGTEDSFENKSALMSSLIVMRQIIGIAKVPATVEFAQEFLEETDRKLVIFVHHKKCGEMIVEQMKQWCVDNNIAQPLSLTAELDSQARFSVQDKFNGPNARLLIASTLASGEGLNLQSCSDCIMHERQWNPANETQAEGRFVRIGQKAQSVNATYMHADGTIDVDLHAIVEAKRRAFHTTMNKGQMEVWNESDIIKKLASNIKELK